EPAGAGEERACDPLLAPEWTPAASPAAGRAMAVAESAAGAAPATRALVRECVLNGLRDAGVDRIGDDTSFAEAGLDSLAAMPVALELEQRTGLAVNTELLYEFPTVAQLAAYIDARRNARRGAGPERACEASCEPAGEAGMRARQADAGADGDGVK
ncbi:acyl carrier protein, partial [Massilia sp. ST3]|uniref:acyl carrier protein n=1 Tax=Massilia sp. ST3 TaxID=2824903 RepID=UPI001B82C698